MTLSIYKLKGFKELSSESSQLKEIYFIYGLAVSSLSIRESIFINFLRENKYSFEGDLVDSPLTQEEAIKFDTHLYDKATLGMLINDFKVKFECHNFVGLFEEFVEIRNVLVHKYMRINNHQLSNEQHRIEIYDDLLYVLSFIKEFDQKMKNHSFFIKNNPQKGLRYKGE